MVQVRGAFFPFVGLVAVAAFLGAACGRPSEQEKAPDTVPWSGATDGTWSARSAGETHVPFGQTSHTQTDSAASAFIFRIDSPPTLTTSDGGKTVTISSDVTVKRVQTAGNSTTADPEGPVSSSLKALFEPGELSAENSTDASHGTDPKVSCQQDQLKIGESTVCNLSFNAVASEIQDSYWWIDGLSMGAWPSQGAPNASSP